MTDDLTKQAQEFYNRHPELGACRDYEDCARWMAGFARAKMLECLRECERQQTLYQRERKYAEVSAMVVLVEQIRACMGKDGQ